MSIYLYFLGAFVSSRAAALVLTPSVVHVARRWGLTDLPNARKVHSAATPRIGGLAVAAAMMGSTIAIFLAVSFTTGEIGGDRARVATMLLSGAFLLIVGLVDDVCDLSGRQKLLALLLAAVGFCSSGGLIREMNLNGHYAVSLGMMAWPVTILWLVAVTVSVNFIDGLDGLAAGIVAIACAAMAVGAAVTWNVPVLIVSLAMLGSLLGFLVFNFNPARVFMGDCGSMFVGFTLAACGVLYAQKSQFAGGLLVPALALSVPFLDLLLTVVRRSVLQRRSLFAAERGHIHHRLLDVGLCQRHAVLLLYAATAGAAVVGMMSFAFLNPWIFYGALLLLVPGLLFMFRAAGSVRGRDTLAAVRRNRAIGREIRNNQRAFEEMQLRFRAAKTFGQWWEQVCASAESLALTTVVLPLKNRDGTPRRRRSSCPTPARSAGRGATSRACARCSGNTQPSRRLHPTREPNE